MSAEDADEDEKQEEESGGESGGELEDVAWEDVAMMVVLPQFFSLLHPMKHEADEDGGAGDRESKAVIYLPHPSACRGRWKDS